jgi:hypothetical protein
MDPVSVTPALWFEQSRKPGQLPSIFSAFFQPFSIGPAVPDDPPSEQLDYPDVNIYRTCRN